MSGKKRQNTIKTTTFSDAQGRTLFSGAIRPGRMHDQTAVRTEGIAEKFHRRPRVRAEVDEGYRGLANEFPGQVSAPPKKPKGDAPLSEHHAWREQRRRQSSRRICVEHTNAEFKAVATAAAVHRAPGDLRRDSSSNRWPGLRPLCTTDHLSKAKHRARARPPDRLLITHQRNRQASMPAR